jgi:uncharacterized protein
MKDENQGGISRRTFFTGALGGAIALGACAKPAARAAAVDTPPAPIPVSVPKGVDVRRVAFPSEGQLLVGDLYLPGGATGKVPAVTLLGPFAYVREQAPSYYAARLAAAGYAALAFDCRGHGESAGAPRRYENPTMKVADAKASVDYLLTRPEIDGAKIFGVGICQGSSPMTRLASEDSRVRGLVTIAAAFLTGGNWRSERGKAARKKFEDTGVVDYLPIIDQSREDVGLPSPYIWNWYRKWIGHSHWQNRYAVMSDAEVWAFDVSLPLKKLACPYLLVHSDEAHDPADARRVFAQIGSGKKQQYFVPGAPDQVKFYDDPKTVDAAAARVVAFLEENA